MSKRDTAYRGSKLQGIKEDESTRCSVFSDSANRLSEREKRIKRKEVGPSNAQGPPVPIPNTEVKLCSAEDTLPETARESSPGPTSTRADEGARVSENLIWGCSSAGRAPALQAGGHGFESHHLHQTAAHNEGS